MGKFMHKIFLAFLALSLFFHNKLSFSQKKDTILLHQLAQNEPADTLRDLLVSGTDVDIKDKEGRTALMLAAKTGKMQNFLILLAHGADLFKRDKLEQNATQYGIKNGHRQKIARVLAGLIVLSRKPFSITPKDQHE